MDLRDNLSSLSAEPQKILKIVISIAVVLLTMWLFMISRMGYTEPSKVHMPVKQERVDNLQSLLDKQDQQTSSLEKSSSGVFGDALVTFIILVALLGGIWFWSEKKSKTGPQNQSRQIGGQVLGEGAQMKIVSINNEVWVLGVTSSSVALLHRYAKDEWNEQIEETGPDKGNFYKLFKSRI